MKDPYTIESDEGLDRIIERMVHLVYPDMAKTGQYYGYPDCCIQSFARRAVLIYLYQQAPLDENQESTHQQHGFIPCPACAAKLVAEGKGISTLISNRQCPTPFPIDEMDEDCQ